MKSNMQTIRLPACEVTKDNDGILICTPSESHNISGEEASEILDALESINNKQAAPVLVDHTISHSLSFEAMQTLSKAKLATVVAFLVTTAINQKTIEYFIEAGKPTYPIQSFTDRDQAMEWLSSYL